MLLPRSAFLPNLAYLAFLVAVSLPLAAQQLLVPPYVQPGELATLDARDEKIIAWLTDQTPGDFTVEFSVTSLTAPSSDSAAASAASSSRTATPTRTVLDLSATQHFYKYAAPLRDLPFDATVTYRVKLAGRVLHEAAFATRKSRAQPVRFAVTGDAAAGRPDARKIADAIAAARPDHLLIAGDIVYSRGLVSEYAAKFWPVYNRAAPTGPALLASTVLYAVLGNHDAGVTRLPELPGDAGIATFDTYPDSLAAFYFFHAPRNGPPALTRPPADAKFAATREKLAAVTHPGFLPVIGPADKVAAFQAAAGATYPALCHYSFDSGPVHFLVLDSNRFTDPRDPLLTAWIRRDLTASRAPWKTVFFHHPGFNASLKHNAEQTARHWSPLFEACGVDVVFSGHVHNYQRTHPLRFAPAADAPAKGLIPGAFTLDAKFDGITRTVPAGIIYLVTGGGGAGLYDTELTGHPEKYKFNPGEPNYIARFISDRHSFTLVEATTQTLTIRQLDPTGTELDRLKITHR
ncbi:MAG: hypothetical protein RLZZ15_4017 [Verrucomicrobiota bacterium]